MIRFPTRLLILTITVALLAGCAVPQSAPEEPAGATQPAGSTQPPQATPVEPVDPGAPLETMPGETAVPDTGAVEATPYPLHVQAAVEALALQLGTTPDQIELVEVESVEWPDASLGCPEPGMQYAQVVTPGYRIVLRSGEDTFEYHAGETGLGVLCGSNGAPLLPLIPVTPGEIDDAEPWMPVD